MIDHAKSILFVGMMGVGKSTIAKCVAQKLDIPWIDTDQLICERMGKSIMEIFDAKGEAGFRAIERKVCKAVLASDHQAVISLGGGAYCDPETHHCARAKGIVIWLQASPETILTRLLLSDPRPVLKEWTVTELNSLLHVRQPFYQACSYVLAMDDLTVDQCAESVMGFLGTRACL